MKSSRNAREGYYIGKTEGKHIRFKPTETWLQPWWKKVRDSTFAYGYLLRRNALKEWK